MARVLVISTHPIQYNSPLFQELAGKVDLKVMYTWGASSAGETFDHGFGIKRSWDIDLLSGYHYEFLNNTAKEPGSHHFLGIINPDIVDRVKAFHPDAILIYGWAYLSHCRILHRFKGKIPIYFRGDSTLLNKPQRGLKASLKRALIGWIYSHVDCCFYVGEHNKQYYRYFGVGEKKLSYAPHVVDNDRFKKTGTRAAFRKVLGIPETDFVFLFAGKFEWNKNPSLLIEAFRSLGAGPTVHLVMVGSGHLEKQLKEMAGDEKNIHFLSFQNQSVMPDVYKMANVFVLPSQSETWGLALNEAMACGLGVIASDKCGGAIELIEEGKNGSIFESNNMEQLKISMHKAMTSHTAWGQASQDKIEDFSLRRLAGLMTEAFAGFREY